MRNRKAKELIYMTHGHELSGENERTGTGSRNVSGKHKIGRGRLRIVWEMETPKNLHARPMDVN